MASMQATMFLLGMWDLYIDSMCLLNLTFLIVCS